ncbi:MAG: hypothetical protein CMQ43_03645 [Gammaproteobacteria bacterium]|jgi:hypothetical protein|nr:hypothetical protein [Gammaproteobacteria bacterium]MBK79996.1 hypothetical protein [Gammaproteobacteria bacterium]|tara:strand:+ start:806 stop:1105 length:300 start_codon:yes stop_codon:yes gene_type:complete
MKTFRPAVLAGVLLLTAGAAFAAEQMDHDSHMQKMQESMAQIRATEDPEERARLLEAHMDQMMAAMREMHQNMGQMMKQMDAQKREARKTHDHRKMRGG